MGLGARTMELDELPEFCFLLIYKHCALPSPRAFFLCAGAWVRACRIAPSQAVVRATPLSTVNYIWFSLLFSGL